MSKKQKFGLFLLSIATSNAPSNNIQTMTTSIFLIVKIKLNVIKAAIIFLNPV